MARIGRPPKYTEAIADQVIDRLAGGEQLVDVSRDIGVAPCTISMWVARNEDFRHRFHSAFVARAWLMAAEITGIVDGIPVDADMARVQRERVRFDARRWLISRLLPQHFGEKVEHTGLSAPVVQILLPDNSRWQDEGDDGRLIEDSASELEEPAERLTNG